MSHRPLILTAALLATLGLGACGSDTGNTGNTGKGAAAKTAADQQASAATDSQAKAKTPASTATVQPTPLQRKALAGLGPLEAAANGLHRSDANVARNAYRHPVQTLEFFGLTQDMTVVELWPGGGAWYTEVLAPVLAERGLLIAANYPADTDSSYLTRASKALLAKLDAEPAVYGKVKVVDFYPPSHPDMGPAGSADLVLVPRTWHNLIRNKSVDAVLGAAFKVLKPGGTLAVIQHRAKESDVPESEERNGYVKESVVIAAAEQHGFVLAARSDINANPFDSRDHAKGVWTLPPSMALCQDLEAEEKSACQARWQVVGESDRMTLKFSKPAV